MTEDEERRHIKKFVKARNHFLRKLDCGLMKETLRNFDMQDPFPDATDETRLAGMHKARLYIEYFNEFEKEESRQWLKEHEFNDSVNWSAIGKWR